MRVKGEQEFFCPEANKDVVGDLGAVSLEGTSVFNGYYGSGYVDIPLQEVAAGELVTVQNRYDESMLFIMATCRELKDGLCPFQSHCSGKVVIATQADETCVSAGMYSKE
jgi:hypothetical protein